MRMYKAAAVALVLQTTLLGAAYAQALNGNPLSDVRVRQAIEYAIDKKLIVDNVFGGYAVPADGLLPNGPFKSDKLEIVYPSLSILAEPMVAVVTGNSDRHGTTALAEEYLKFLYTPEGQKIVARHYYRPADRTGADPADLARLKDLELVKVDDAFGGWAAAQAKHFDDGGVFDQIYRPAGAAPR